MSIKRTSLDLIRVTENAAIAASAYIGSGNKEELDKVAAKAMRQRLNDLDFSVQVVIGEGKKDKVEHLENGEILGKGEIFDIACDPVDGTTQASISGPEAMSVIGIANHNCMFKTEEFYMLKMAYGPDVSKFVKLRIENSLENNIKIIAEVLNKHINKIMVCILDRPRHDKWIKLMRSMGVRIKLIKDCDISAAIATCVKGSGIDLLYGIGGAPESVITACALKCLGGDFQSIISDKDGILDNKIFNSEDLVKGECAFVATGVTDGSLLKGVRFDSNMPTTHSIYMRSESGTVRRIITEHGN